MSISRRQFSAAFGAAGLSILESRVLVRDDDQQRLRVIAYNVFAGAGWPSNRKLAKKAVANGQMAKRLAMELALHDPDIINFSESPGEKMVKEIAELLEMNFVRFPSSGDWPGALLSRFEISESKNVPLDGQRPKELFTRHWGRAMVKLPNREALIVHSAHLYPTADPTVRIREVTAMLQTMRTEINAGHSLILMGDLNLGPDSQEYNHWIEAGFVDTFTKVGVRSGHTYRSDIPKWRVDYVLAAGPIANGIIESRPLFEGAFRLNIADKESFALSDHLPQLAVFQLAK